MRNFIFAVLAAAITLQFLLSGHSIAATVLDQIKETDPDTGEITIRFGHKKWAGLSFVEIGRCSYGPYVLKDKITKIRIEADVAKSGSIAGQYESEASNPKVVQKIRQELVEFDYVQGRACRALADGVISRPTYLKFAGDILFHQKALVSKLKPKTIFVMDSHLRSYRPKFTQATGQTNADDILRWLPSEADAHLERTNTMWVRQKFVVSRRPDLVVIHFSAFESEDFACSVWAVSGSVEAICNEIFFGLIRALVEAGSKVQIYTRTKGVCAQPMMEGSFVRGFIKHLGVSKEFSDQITLFDMSGKYRKPRFDDPGTGRDIQDTVTAILDGTELPEHLAKSGVCNLSIGYK